MLVLPQGVAYALIAGLPPEYGLYSAIAIPIVAGLFGSSFHMVSGPTAALSIVVMSAVSPQAEVGTEHYVALVITLSFWVGIVQLTMASLKFGFIVNFVSHTVIVAFTAGAAVLIAASQVKYLLGVPGDDLADGSWLALLKDAVDWPSALIGVFTLLSALGIKRFFPRLPHLLIALLLASFIAWWAKLEIPMVGEIPAGLPPLSTPLFSLSLLEEIFPSVISIALLGFLEALAISRAIALRSGQAIDGEQELVGQGLSNVVGSFFSCYPGSGSFTRSGANFDAGATSPLAMIFSGLLLILVLIFFSSVTIFLPLAAMAGSILLIAWNLLEFKQIQHAVAGSWEEKAVFSATFISTLLLKLEYAIYVGIAVSLLFSLRRFCQPRVVILAPSPGHRRRKLLNYRSYGLAQCPQLLICRIDGAIFFGSVNHIRKTLEDAIQGAPQTSHIIVVCKGISFIDREGALAIQRLCDDFSARGIEVALCSLKGKTRSTLANEIELDVKMVDSMFEYPNQAIASSFKKLNPEVCEKCTHKVFDECSPTDQQALIHIAKL
ncbi:SulP family inorganic anion transporter [Grimontia sp. NTOU-MAR1]|uniref:SulP family inorganic anion transporter n=1 Tax=Grimontia sp. NTOU-MAR1 TaxID=3111011 RepID=UPI002DB8BC91|nr:SulP family inorganic anion transporter [Grimontia sp. NTOU-MAR1]WRV96759.1 SulP family inorganic anion transporter [Grimontia sp. NTOU-MAR1]